LAVLAVSGAFLLGADSAVARSFPTTITYDGSVALSGGNTFVDSGHITSSKSFCTRLRLVTLVGHYPDGTSKLLDVAFTSLRGAWATKASHTGADRLRAKVTRSSFRRHGHRKVCEGASVAVPLS
jgi:hypothetical protein